MTTLPLSEAMLHFFQFLCTFEKKCILTAHNCSFDYPRLMNAIEKVFMKKHFQSIIYGFCDTLPIIRKCTGKKGKGQNKLQILAENFGINCDKAHDAIEDVIILEKVLIKLNISTIQLRESTISWIDATNKIMFAQNLPKALKSLNALNDCTSISIRKKLIGSNITYDMIVSAYKENSFDGLSKLLGRDENGVIQVTKDKRVLNKLYDYMKKSIIL